MQGLWQAAEDPLRVKGTLKKGAGRFGGKCGVLWPDSFVFLPRNWYGVP